jgi:hypothetical protein
MPTIQITDDLGLSLDADLAPGASLLEYARDLPSLILHGASISSLQGLTLRDPTVVSLAPTLSFAQPVSLGANALELTIGADAGFSLRIFERTAASIALFSTDDYGDKIEIPAGSCYVAIGFKASAAPGLGATSGSLSFCLNPSLGIDIESYQPFSAGADALSIADALRRCIGQFVIPATLADLKTLPAGAIVTVTGSGALTFSAAANLLTVANPLATVPLPGPLPAISVQQGASVTVGAAWKISADYQVRAQKMNARSVRLGWYRKHGSDFTVTASASAGLTAGPGKTDLFAPIITAISSNAQADLKELQQAGLPPAEISAIHDTVKAAIDRKLELAVTAAFSSLGSDEAAFLYEVDLEALDDKGQQTLHAALRGDLSGLADLSALPAGITGLRSIYSTASARRFSLTVNLLGIFNWTSVSQLALSGRVTFTPSTGDLVIADAATASRIQTAAVNFGADEDKLRQVMAESFLITAAYRGSRAVMNPLPQLASSHLFFRLDNNISVQDLRRWVAIAPALGLALAPLPAGIDHFGRTSVLAQARYDDALSRALFFRPDGSLRDHNDYEIAGRRALALLVPPDGDDAFRLGPATNDSLWNKMKELGPANFQQLMPQAQADGVRPDYLAIEWWADSMCGTGQVLARLGAFAAQHPGAAPDDPQFQELRKELAGKLRDVAARAHEQFGAPWGLVAMFLASEAHASAALQIVGPHFVMAPKGGSLAASG